MSSPCRDVARTVRGAAGGRGAAFVMAALMSIGSGAAQGAPAPEPVPLRVCADADDLPASRADASGYENRIAAVVADALRRPLAFTWVPQGRGFVRRSLGAGVCDVIVGVPAGWDRVLTTRPYYRSGYVFVVRAGDDRAPTSFDDPRLADVDVGVQLVGDGPLTTPPGLALAARGAVDHVVG